MFRLATISFCGSYAGPVLGYALGGFLVEKYGAYSFLSPFYVSCTLNFIWLIVFCLSAHDTPATHPTISQDERDYIERTIGDTVEHMVTDRTRINEYSRRKTIRKRASLAARGSLFSRRCQFGQLLWRISAAVGPFIC